MIIKKENYIETVRRPYPPFWSSLILSGSSNEIYYKPFFKKPYARRGTIICDYVWYYRKKSEDEACRLIAHEWTNKKRLEQVIQLFKKREQDLLSAVDKDFKKLCSAYEFYMPAVGLIYLVEIPFSERIKQLLTKKLSAEETEKLLKDLSIPLQDNFYKKEECDLIRAKSIKKHVKKYEWLLSRYGSDNPYTGKEARQKLARINKEIFWGKYNQEKKTIKKTIAEAKKTVGKANEYLIDGLQFILFYRTHRTDIMNKVAYLYVPALKNIALKNGLSYEELLMCTKDEVINKKIPPRKLLANREKGHAMIIKRNKILCLTGKEYKAIKSALAYKVSGIEVIKGVIASEGIVRGAVKIILSRNDFSKIDNGDILVTSMTTPEMVPIMKRAAAFVTDEGGITCHAAIISREMKKPCLIGTKIATKVLKNGDEVEVNANRGIVRIIKRN